MNLTVKISLCILRSLRDNTPPGYAATDASLRADIYAEFDPNPTLSEIEEAITGLELKAYIVGTRSELTGARKWMITDTGKLALSQI